jgi:SNF2 family DNA or RNA helicase
VRNAGQAADRAHRIGQKKRVTVRRLLMRHTVEEKMMELKARKAALYAALLGEAEGRGTAAITREDFLRLLEG